MKENIEQAFKDKDLEFNPHPEEFTEDYPKRMSCLFYEEKIEEAQRYIQKLKFGPKVQGLFVSSAVDKAERRLENLRLEYFKTKSVIYLED